ncbi:MAG: DeoR/GlpR family DNA-binding transcription regulator [Planctomycetota bacterium]|jgi:DeoR/GlpR family transcriptional regulator of sugar metabolism|nr:DeoR/GlpR family DNA-binding transcription regulator [Planctomycetota bacterium]
MPVLAEPRQKAILDIIDSGGQARVSELALRFSVSPMTIRRDFLALEEKGLAHRVHGGALAVSQYRFSDRLSANLRAKTRAIAKLADFIPSQGCLYLDGSTTMLGITKYLSNRGNLQAATNNIETFNRLTALTGPAALLLGGSLDVRTDNLIGPLALRSLDDLVFDAAFFSARGLYAGIGLNEVTVEDALVKEKAAGQARLVLVAVDHSKLGVVAGCAWRPGLSKTILATDLDPGDQRLTPFREMFSRII